MGLFDKQMGKMMEDLMKNEDLKKMMEEKRSEFQKLIPTPKVKVVNKSDNPLPKYATPGSAGMDVRAYIEPVAAPPVGVDIDQMRRIYLKAGERASISTGLYFELPEGYEMQVRPRSGLAIKNGITIVNSPGTLDCVPKGTKIKTLNGEMLVEDLFENNDKIIIYSFNESENIIEEDYIEDMWVVENVNCLNIMMEDGNSISLPLEKEVYTNRGWVKSKNLTLNDEILNFD